ncbi:oxidoreductase [Corynebacterium pyruviciproducens]
MFGFLKKGKKNARPKGVKRAPGSTIRSNDLQTLKQWAAPRGYVEGFVEPETFVNEMSIVLVDESGEHIRRKIGGPKGIDVVSKELGIDIYDVEETGYPQRMRDRIEQDRLIRKRLEYKERKAKLQEEAQRKERD